MDEAKPVKHPQYIYVYVEEDVHIELWIREHTRQFAGDYCEAGIYGDKKYFIKKEKGKQPLYIFWSTYLGFDGGWYLGQELGGASLAWAMVDGDLPPESGWLIRGSVPGYHVDTSMKVKKESTMLHEVHVVENCLCTPFRVLKSCGIVVEGACIATMSGSAENVAQLRKHPRCTSCMDGLLTEMSCSVPLSWAFEHSIDAWYRAWFVDGFCYRASYERAITGTERDIQSLDRKRHKTYLRWLYHGYTSSIAEEMACHEPFAQALEDLLSIHIHVRKYTQKTRKPPTAAKIANGTDKSGKSGFMKTLGLAACCVCCNKQKAKPTTTERGILVQSQKPAIKSSPLPVEEPKPAIKSRQLTVEKVRVEEPKPVIKSSQLKVEESKDAIDVRLLSVQGVKPTMDVKTQSKKEDVSCFCCGKPKSKPKSKEVKPAVTPAVIVGEVDDPRFWPLKEPKKGTLPVEMSETTEVGRRLLMEKQINTEVQQLNDELLKLQKLYANSQVDSGERIKRVKQEVGNHARELQGVIAELMEEINQLKEKGTDSEKQHEAKLDELRLISGGHLDSCQAMEQRIQVLESSEVQGKKLLKQKNEENEVLQKELGIAMRMIEQLEGQEQAKKATEGMQRGLLSEANEGQAKRVAALEAELRILKETEAVQKVRMEKLDRLAGTYSQRNAELEESEKVRLLKVKESDAALSEANSKYKDLDALHKQRTAEKESLQAEVDFLRDQAGATKRDQQDVVLKSQYVQLEASLESKAEDNRLLRSELSMLQQKFEQAAAEQKSSAKMQDQDPLKEALTRELEVKSKRVKDVEYEISQMIQNESAIQASVVLQKAKVEELEREAGAAAARFKQKEAELEKIVEAYKQRCAELEGAGSMLKQSEASVWEKTRQLEASLQQKSGEIQMVRTESGMLQQQVEERAAKEMEYQARDARLQARANELEASFQQKVGESDLLRAEIGRLQKKLDEGKVTELEYQQREIMLKACQPQDQSSQVEELEYQIRCIRETEAKNMKAFQLAQAEHDKRCQELENSKNRGQELEQHHRQRCQDLERNHAVKCQEMDQQHTQRCKELEEQLGAARQQASNAEVRVEEVQSIYALKIQELEGSYGQQIQDRDTLVTTVQQTRQGLEQELLDVRQKAFEEQSLAAQHLATMQEELQKLQKQLFTGQQLRQDLEQQLVSAEQQGFERSATIARQSASEHEALEKQVLTLQSVRRELEGQLMAEQQKTSLQEQQLLMASGEVQNKAQDVEAYYVNKLQELEASYGEQFQVLASKAEEAQTLKQQLQVIALQTEADKARLGQYEQELGESASIRSSLQAQLEAMNQQQAINVQASIDAMREGLEDSHSRQLQEVQASHIVQIEQLQTEIAEGNQLSAALEAKLLNIEQSNQAKQGEEMRISQLQAEGEVLAGELGNARLTIQELQQVAAQQEEQMREREYAYEKRQIEFEGEISTLRQQVLMSSRPDEDFARATRELRDLSGAMENERALYAAQVEELQGALMRTTEEASVLRQELAQAKAGHADHIEVVEMVQKPITVPVPAPTVVYSQQPGLTIESASRSVPASPPKYAVETVQSAKYVENPVRQYVVESPPVVETVYMEKTAPQYVMEAPPVVEPAQSTKYVVENQARQYVVEGPPVVQRLSSAASTQEVREVRGSYSVNQESMALPTSAPLLTSQLAAQGSVQLPVPGSSQGSLQLPVRSGLAQKRVITASPMQTREDRIPTMSPMQTRVDRVAYPTTGSLTRPVADSRVMYATETGRSGYMAETGISPGMSIESRPGT